MAKRLFSILIMLYVNLVFSCKKSNEEEVLYHCKFATTSKIPSVLSLAGFSRSELDTILFKTYQNGSNFSVLASTRVIDTTYLRPDDSIRIIPGADVFPGEYEVIIPATGHIYRLSGFQYVDSVREYTTTTPCYHRKAAVFQVIDSLVINGKLVPAQATLDRSFIYLYR